MEFNWLDEIKDKIDKDRIDKILTNYVYTMRYGRPRDWCGELSPQDSQLLLWAIEYEQRRIIDSSGIYAITVDNYVMYVGQSKNLERRFSQHCAALESLNENKYRILREAEQLGHTIDFVCLDNQVSVSELEMREADFIKYYQPPLNSKIHNTWRVNLQNQHFEDVVKKAHILQL